MKSNIKVGDIIVAYHSGFHEVTDIEERKGGLPPLVYYVQIADSKGKRRKGRRTLKCDMCFCGPYKEWIEEELQKLEKTKQSLITLSLNEGKV